MRHIIAMLLFASIGALITIYLLPPLPAYRTRQTHQMRMRRPTRDWERDPIAGVPGWEGRGVNKDVRL
jgi:hypothetical protein